MKWPGNEFCDNNYFQNPPISSNPQVPGSDTLIVRHDWPLTPISFRQRYLNTSPAISFHLEQLRGRERVPVALDAICEIMQPCSSAATSFGLEMSGNHAMMAH